MAQGQESTSGVQGEKDARLLELGKPIERELAGGQAHYYRITVEAGQYLHLVVEQKGIDVVIALYGPDDKKLTEVDSPNGAYGPEPISVIADAPSSYRLEVGSLEKDSSAGRYEVKITDQRTATAQDHIRVMAERAYADGRFLELQGGAESLRKAIEKYEEALRLYRTAGDRSGEATTLNNIGLVYYLLGERQKALDYYNQALPLTRGVGDRGGEASTLSNIGAVYDFLGEKQKALDYYNQALPLRRAVGDRGGEATTLHNIGAVYNFLCEKQKALDYYNQALPLLRAVGDRRVEATTLNNVGLVYDALGENQKALDYHNQALPLSRAVGDRSGEAKTLLGMAKSESVQGKLLDARSTIESALNIIESLRTKVVSPELRSSYFATTQDYYEFSIDLLMQLHELHPDRGYDREALQTAERERARSLLDGLVEARLEIRSGVGPALLERERELGQLLSAKTERRMRLLNGKHTEQQATEVANEIESLTATYQEVESEIREKSPRYAALTQPQPLNLGEIQQQVLDDQMLLLEYFLGKERSYLWVVSADSLRSYELPKREEIEEAALRVKKLLTARAAREKGESLEQWQARISDAEARYLREAERLSKMILEPAGTELSGKRLAIVPDGELQEVAFGALPVPRSGSSSDQITDGNERGDWRPMIAEHEIVSLPSASALAVLRKETAGREPAPKGVAVLADPVFDKDDDRIKLMSKAESGKAAGAETEGIGSRDLLRATRDVMGEDTGIPRLPYSKREAEAICR